MYKDVLRSIADVQIFPLIGMCIFMLFFIGLIVYVILMKKDSIREMESIPFENDEILGKEASLALKPTAWSAPSVKN